MRMMSAASASVCINTLWVRSLAQPQICGQFDLVRENVWKQAVGPGWIYNSRESLWFVTVHESCVGDTGGIIGALDGEKASPVDVKNWKRWDGPVQGWNERLDDGEVAVTGEPATGQEWEKEFHHIQKTRVAQAPEKLEVLDSTPASDSRTVPSELLGVYSKLPSTMFCSQPVYENKMIGGGSGGRIYGDAFGFWRIGRTEDVLDTAGPPGLVQSSDTLAPTAWPHEITSWMTDGAGCGCDKSTSEGEEEPVAEWAVNQHLSVYKIS